MSHRRTPGSVLLSALLVAAITAGAAAQTASPACRPLIEAEKKQIMTPHHVYMTDRASGPAAVYTAHTENEGVVGDSRIWVAGGTGLPVRQEEDLDTGLGDKRHMSLRYDYADVHAPAGVR